MLSLGLKLGSFIGAGDSTPGGPTDIWLWEDAIGVLWEDGYFIQLD